MTDLKIDENTHQRVLDFLTFEHKRSAAASISGISAAMEMEAPATIAQQTAADLMRFLRGENAN